MSSYVCAHSFLVGALGAWGLLQARLRHPVGSDQQTKNRRVDVRRQRWLISLTWLISSFGHGVTLTSTLGGNVAMTHMAFALKHASLYHYLQANPSPAVPAAEH